MARLWCACFVSLLSLAAMSSCGGNVEGELTAVAGTNKVDDDGDGPRDCDDPDCWVFCPPRNALQYSDASSNIEHDAALDAARTTPPKPDAGKPGMSVEDDAGSPPSNPAEEDAGA